MPVSHFWGTKTLETERTRPISAQEAFVTIRTHMIGALLRQGREEAKLDLDSLSDKTAIPAATLLAYELGEEPAPMHELAVLASALDKNIAYFLETYSQYGRPAGDAREVEALQRPAGWLREFAANPQNIGFIEIALSFSQMNNDVLRQIAVSMLDITGY